MRVLVTGASGFVGSRTCAHLELAGHEVIRVLHSRPSGQKNGYRLDITDAAAFDRLNSVGEIDAIVHCAGIAHRFGRVSREEFWRVNVEGARNVAEYAVRNGVCRFVHISSVLVYGVPTSNHPVTEYQTPNPEDDYSCSKLAGERAVAEVCTAEGVKLTILRPVPIIGEGSRGNVARLIRAIDRKHFLWIGDGRNERSFVYMDDVAGAILASLSMQDGKSTLNVTGGTITVRELVETISECLGASHPARLLPHKPAQLAVSVSRPFARVPMIGRYHRTLETWLADAVYSGDALTSLGFSPSVDLREGLRREVDFYLASKR